jgi:hypothetical protein
MTKAAVAAAASASFRGMLNIRAAEGCYFAIDPIMATGSPLVMGGVPMT